jgi:hypothetical protein
MHVVAVSVILLGCILELRNKSKQKETSSRTKKVFYFLFSNWQGDMNSWDSLHIKTGS